MMWWQSMTSNESGRLTRFLRNDLEVCIRLKSVTRASTFKATNSPSVTLWRYFNVTFHTNSNSTSTSVCHVCVGQVLFPMETHLWDWRAPQVCLHWAQTAAGHSSWWLWMSVLWAASPSVTVNNGGSSWLSHVQTRVCTLTASVTLSSRDLMSALRRLLLEHRHLKCY